MNPIDRRCWQCGEFAPSGVCWREHPGFSFASAIESGNVEVPYPRFTFPMSKQKRCYVRPVQTCELCGVAIVGRYRNPARVGTRSFCTLSHSARQRQQEMRP